MKHKFLLAFAIAILAVSSTLGFIYAKSPPPPSGYVYPIDQQTEYNQGVGITLHWVTNMPGPVTIWLTTADDDVEVSGYSWVQSASSGDFVMGTAGLAINQTYDIWISVESDGAPLILNINNYWEFTIVSPCQASQSDTATPDYSGVVTVNQPSTGVITTVFLDRDTVPPDSPVTVTTAYFGTTQPANTGTLSVAGLFFDVKVHANLIDGGTLIDVSITNDAFNSGSTMQYWNPQTGIWTTVVTDFVAPHTLIGHFTYSQLQGTPIFVTPEYTLGALLALSACFAGLVIFKARNHLPLPRF